MQQGTGGTDPERKLQRQLGQRFDNPPQLPLEASANVSQSSHQNASLASAGPANINAEITPGMNRLLNVKGFACSAFAG